MVADLACSVAEVRRSRLAPLRARFEVWASFAGNMVRTAGLEPTTSCSGGKRSIRLSYARTLNRW